MEQNGNVLIVDDEEGLRFGLRVFLSRNGFSVIEAGNLTEAKKEMQNHIFNIAILDIRLKDEESGLDLMTSLKEQNPEMVILIITGYAQLETAIEALRKGANDYMQKPLVKEKVLASILKNRELHLLRRENRQLKEELNKGSEQYRIITESPVMKEILRTADQVKDLAPNILITGESGTGKEVLARYIHNTGKRMQNNFVGLNSASLSDNLLLSELFGHRKGAFTGAVENKAGKFELAHKGTFFLDEVGDMSMDIQAKFLRVLEERSFEPLGGNNRIEFDTHIIAATNHNIPALIKKDLFREDLFFRLNVIHFNLPPLRERKEDMGELCNSFIKMYCRQYRKIIEPLGEEEVKVLQEYDWPGNIRELKNLINRIVILTDRNRISCQQIIRLLGSISPFEEAGTLKISSPHCKTSGSLGERLNPIVEQYERQILIEALEKNHFNRTRTAEELGITRKTIGRKLQHYNIKEKKGHK